MKTLFLLLVSISSAQTISLTADKATVHNTRDVVTVVMYPHFSPQLKVAGLTYKIEISGVATTLGWPNLKDLVLGKVVTCDLSTFGLCTITTDPLTGSVLPTGFPIVHEVGVMDDGLMQYTVKITNIVLLLVDDSVVSIPDSNTITVTVTP